MTEQAQTGQLSGLATDPVVAEADRGKRVARGIFEALWDLLTSMRFSLFVILAMAALGLVGTLVIQAPVGVVSDATAKADWLAGVRPRFGGWTDVFDRLQFFSIFGSIWFRGLTAFLAISLLACMVQRAPGLWRGGAKPRGPGGGGFFAHA